MCLSHADKTQLWQDYAVTESHFCLMCFWDLAQSRWNIFYFETLKLLQFLVWYDSDKSLIFVFPKQLGSRSLVGGGPMFQGEVVWDRDLPALPLIADENRGGRAEGWKKHPQENSGIWVDIIKGMGRTGMKAAIWLCCLKVSWLIAAMRSAFLGYFSHISTIASH